MVSEIVHRAGYDLSSWQGIAKLLADARARLKESEYQPFYDAVTAYSRSRGTDTVRLAEIEKKLATWANKSPDLIVREQPKAQAVSKPESEIKPSESEMSDDGDADAILAAALKEQSHTPEKKEMPVQERKESDNQVSSKDQPAFVPQKSEEPVEKEHIITLSEARNRILDIKHEVHELVGNPVVLVGELGSIGRVYMQALLKATRATMGGSGGAIMPAMRELESVYEKLRVAALSDETPEEEIETVPTVVESPAEEEVPAAAVSHEEEVVPTQEDEVPPEDLEIARIDVDIPTAHAEVMREPVLSTEPEPVISREYTKAEHTPVEVRHVTRPRPQFHTAPAGAKSLDEHGAPAAHEEELTTLRARLNALEHKLDDAETKSREVPKIPENNISHDRVPEVEKSVKLAEVKRQEETAVPERISAPVVSVAPEKPVPLPVKASPEPLHTLPTFTNIKKDREQEYQAEEVTEGLRSLLMSWDIFRGGLLSGKARGIEHPLYLTIRELTMNDVLAGKFAGAKTHTVISINDYVNAWRFEQGIEYNPLETFEHYVRRVIHRILARTKDM